MHEYLHEAAFHITAAAKGHVFILAAIAIDRRVDIYMTFLLLSRVCRQYTNTLCT
jgi:hypothetical protein